MARIVIFLIAFALMLGLQPDGPEGGWSLVSQAHADDDDDRDDDDDDDDGPRIRLPVDPPRLRRPARVAPPPAAPAPLPQRAENEVLARGLSQQDLSDLMAQDFLPIEITALSGGQLLARLLKPSALTMNEALQVVRDMAPADGSDFNHFYRTEQAAACAGIDCPARQMIDWPVATGCGLLPRIGMVDTGLNAEHAALAGARIQMLHLDDPRTRSDLLHGTAVAALLVGTSDSRAPGLVPGAQLVAVDAFHRAGTDQRSDAFSLIRALDQLSRQQVRIVNLSLAGPPNAALEAQVAQMDAAGMLLVAAAGNNGPAAGPAYPAAYPQVIAVTAVDRRGQVYRRAGRGDHIDLAAPGVDVWTAASVSGARTKTGTSFAAPFVTAAAALLLQANPGLGNDDIRRLLMGSARDLGAAGRDPVFGAGLIAPPAACP